MIRPVSNAHRIVWIHAGLLAVLLFVSPLAAAPPDAWITMKAKMALITDEGVRGTAVNVDTVNGQVTLHGKVYSAEEKEKASTVVQKIDGVRGVRNLLQVTPKSKEDVVQESDDHIKTQVGKALEANKTLKDSDISVRSVNNGVVLLGGKAKTLPAHLTAIEVASSVPGVRRVASEIESPDTVADAEIWRQRKTEPSDKGGISGAAQDMWVTSATKIRLMADSRTPALDINVDTRDGVVTLFGMVPTKEAKSSAEADARKVSGVKTVKNELQVVPQAKQKAVKVHDDAIERDLKKAFENHDNFKDIKVEVKNCVARLTGTVPTGMERLEAAVVARSTHGVCSVQDDLRISD